MESLSPEEVYIKVANYQAQILPENDIAASVVMILLVTEKNTLEILLTKRADTLPDYAGHFSLPGGMRDPIDNDLYQTASRELFEELNIATEDYRYVGQLDDALTRDMRPVRPFVITMPKSVFETNYKIAEAEIAAIHYLPIEKLSEFKDEPRLHAITKRRPSYVFNEDEIFVWGLTANILVKFYDVIKS